MILRDQLETVIQKKKIDEVQKWFQDHFIVSTKEQYIERCPFLIIQGPTGCGKTTTLRYVAKKIGIPIQEFCETTDMVAIHNLEMPDNKDQQHQDAEERSFDRRQAAKFERFVIQKLRMVPLEDPKPIAPSADSEFDSDDELEVFVRSRPKPVEQKPSGIIIHVESLAFAKSHKILMSTMKSIIRTIKQLALFGPRRAAVVFENFDRERDTIPLPAKFKQAIGLEVIKFNPVIRANMKKFIELKMRNYSNIALDREAIETLINDCDGDISACIKSLELMDARIGYHPSALMGLDDEISFPNKDYQANKKQRLNPKPFKLSASLMRDVTRSCDFFNLMGKIFYQKRLYPDESQMLKTKKKKYRSIERPYPPENTTDYLFGRLSMCPKKLLSWLHQHYPQFCGSTNIDKASLFMGYLTDTDTISTNAMHSSQFYELHYILDQQQINIALEFTKFSLYEDQSNLVKPSHKKVRTDHGNYVLKSSVESASTNDSSNQGLYQFNRPENWSITRVIEDRQIILKYLSDEVLVDLSRVDSAKILTDYLPYLSIMSDSWSHHQLSLSNDTASEASSFLENDTSRLIKILESLETSSPNTDFERQHEQLLEVIEKIEEGQRSKMKGGDGAQQDTGPKQAVA